jgi:hypothetical protein
MAGLRIGTCLLALLACGVAQAQQQRLPPAAMIECLAPSPEVRGAPEYPFDAWKLGHEGTVRVALTFSDGNSAPDVSVLKWTEFRSLVDTVRTHVAAWRFPCASTLSDPVRLELDFVFKREQRQVLSSVPADPEHARRAQLGACITPDLRKEPIRYPWDALRAGEQGRVVATLRFDSSTGAPTVTVLARDRSGPLATTILRETARLRLPCYDGRPLDIMQVYIFRIENSAFGFNRPSFRDLLPMVKGIRQQRLLLDTQTMDCPFSVRFHYLQPHRRNEVRQIGNYNAARAPLLEWLASAEFDLPSKSLDAIYGDEAELRIPCVKIDLNPNKE